MCVGFHYRVFSVQNIDPDAGTFRAHCGLWIAIDDEQRIADLNTLADKHVPNHVECYSICNIEKLTTEFTTLTTTSIHHQDIVGVGYRKP